MEEKGVYLAIQTPRQVRKKPMYKNGMYRETDKMSDLICENYPMVLVMSRFGIALGFGEKNIGEVCRQNVKINIGIMAMPIAVIVAKLL